MDKKPPKIDCDLCIDPGACCRAFPLNHYFELGATLEAIRKLLVEKNLAMFRPLRRYREWSSDGKWWEQWLFRCTKLKPNGRCGIYDTRPNLCRTYEPGCDGMCVHMRLPNGQPVLPQLKSTPKWRR